LRRLALVGGFALIVLAFAAASRVTDTREGLVAEIVTLLGGLAGIGLLTYAFAARPNNTNRPSPRPFPREGRETTREARPRSNRDLILGVGGVLLAAVLVSGLALSGGILWAGFGLALLLPMIAGSVYLCVRFLRANP
jgi:hypothetical protein